MDNFLLLFFIQYFIEFLLLIVQSYLYFNNLLTLTYYFSTYNILLGGFILWFFLKIYLFLIHINIYDNNLP